MSISLSGWLSHLLPQWVPNRRHARRQQRCRTSEIESLENRDLLSATSGLPIVDANQTAEVAGLERAVQPNGLSVLPGNLDMTHGLGRSLKIGHLNHQKMAPAKQAAPVSDFSGNWWLGVNGEQPSDLFELNVQQVGRRVVGTITIGDGNETQATLRGRVTDSQLFARIRIVGDGSRGVIVVSKLSSNIFQGTMSVKHPGEPLQIFTLVGMK